jgi:hypothetical protein
VIGAGGIFTVQTFRDVIRATAAAGKRSRRVAYVAIGSTETIRKEKK